MICNSCVIVLHRMEGVLHIMLNGVLGLVGITSVLQSQRTHSLPPWPIVPLQQPKLVQHSFNSPHFMECESLLSSHNSPPVVRNMSQLNPFLILPFCFFQRCLSTIPSSTSGSKDGLFPSGCHTRTVHEVSSYLCYTTDPSQPPSFHKLNIAKVGYTKQISDCKNATF
jgi:hypothetical protein